jgi:hypothetical protein
VPSPLPARRQLVGSERVVLPEYLLCNPPIDPDLVRAIDPDDSPFRRLQPRRRACEVVGDDRLPGTDLEAVTREAVEEIRWHVVPIQLPLEHHLEPPVARDLLLDDGIRVLLRQLREDDGMVGSVQCTAACDRRQDLADGAGVSQASSLGIEQPKHVLVIHGSSLPPPT